MQGIGSLLIRVGLLLAILLIVRSGCTQRSTSEKPRNLNLSQTWELQPGSVVAGHRVSGGLGDISIELKGHQAYAPFDGKVQPYKERCIIFSGDEVPAYLFRLCGLSNPKLGDMAKGTAIGSGDYLEFAALRKQPDGTWAFVEPSKSILEQTLKQP